MKIIQIAVGTNHGSNVHKFLVYYNPVNGSPYYEAVGSKYESGTAWMTNHMSNGDRLFSNFALDDNLRYHHEVPRSGAEGRILNYLFSSEGKGKVWALQVDQTSTTIVGIVFKDKLNRFFKWTFDGYNPTHSIFVPIVSNAKYVPAKSGFTPGSTSDITTVTSSVNYGTEFSYEEGLPVSLNAVYEVSVNYTKTIKFTCRQTEDPETGEEYMLLGVDAYSYNQASNPSFIWYNGVNYYGLKDNAVIATFIPCGMYALPGLQYDTEYAPYSTVSRSIVTEDDFSTFEDADAYNRLIDKSSDVVYRYDVEQQVQNNRISQAESDINAIEADVANGFYSAT